MSAVSTRRLPSKSEGHGNGIANAKKLMAAAGYPEGEITAVLMVFNTPVHPANSERVRAQWLKIWPKMKITPLASAGTAHAMA